MVVWGHLSYNIWPLLKQCICSALFAFIPWAGFFFVLKEIIYIILQEQESWLFTIYSRPWTSYYSRGCCLLDILRNISQKITFHGTFFPPLPNAVITSFSTRLCFTGPRWIVAGGENFRILWTQVIISFAFKIFFTYLEAPLLSKIS